MSVNSLPKIVTRQRRGCDLNPGPSAPESSTLTTRLSSRPPGQGDKCPVPPGGRSVGSGVVHSETPGRKQYGRSCRRAPREDRTRVPSFDARSTILLMTTHTGRRRTSGSAEFLSPP